nr:chlorophyll a-b binding protein 3C, chloroplastic [Tanacetum cinerariifolium]
MTNTQTPPPATIVVNPTGAPVTNTVANHAKIPIKFNGKNFKRWQQKMFFYLTTLGLARFLKETVPQVEPPPKDPLYNVYCKTTTAKELGESLERKYKIEDAGTKKFVVARFMDYKMVDSKNVISQVEFKNYLKHKQNEMSVEDLVTRLCIEEDNRLAQKDTYTPDSAKANMIEHAGSSSRSNPKGKGKDKRKNDKKSKGKSKHLAPKAEIANMVNDDVNMIAMVFDVYVMISEVNLVERLTMDGSCTWVISQLLISRANEIILKMTSEKELKLTNVLYVLEIHKNLVGYAMNGDSGQARTPIDTIMHLSKNRGLGIAQLEYSRIIGMLMYLMTGTRPKLAYAVSRLSRNPDVIEGYSDANWISDINDSRSTKFIALDKCGEEAEWLRQFVKDIPRWPKPVTTISIHCDSKSAMGRAKSTMYNEKSRHIRRRHNSIRQLLSSGVISIDYVASKDNIANPFTKGLSRELVGDIIVEEAIFGDTIVGDNFGISNENVVPESVVVPKANVGVEIIIVSDDDDNEVVRDTLDTVVAETDDEIYSAVVGMSGFILEACVMQWKVAALKLIPTRQIQRIQNQKNTCLCIGVTPDYTPEKAVQQASLEGNMENQLSNVKQSGNEGSEQFIQTRKSQRIQNQKTS